MTSDCSTHETGGSAAEAKDLKSLFTAFATNSAHSPNADIFMQFDSLDKAMAQLNEWIESDINDPDGRLFDRFGILFGSPPTRE
jgi:hypothetical protein